MAKHFSTQRALLLAAWVAAAAGCRSTVQPNVSQLPRVLPPSPTLQQVIEAVNRNTEQITSFTCAKAALSGEGFPTLRTTIAFQKPNCFRLRAETALTGAELDLGSNDQVFWFWMRRNQPPTLYFARHEQFRNSPARQTLALEPQWLVQAMGLPYFDIHLPLQGPISLPGDRLEVRTVEETPAGPRTKSTVIDAAHAFVVQQSVYDAQGRLMASAEALQHRRDPLTNLVMPSVVTFQSPAAQLAMRIDLGPTEINRPRPNAAGLWTVPEYPGAAVVDLCDPRQQMQQAAPPASQMAQPPTAAIPPDYRGRIGQR